MEGLKIKCETVEQRKQAQELLFSLGYGWNCGGTKEVRYLNMPYLYAYPRSKDMTFGRIESHSSFIKNRNKEITLQELRDMVNQDQDEPFLTPETTLNDQYAEIEQVRKHRHYFKDVSNITEIDVYTVLKLFDVTDPCLQHIVKKALCAGKRGHKDMMEDLQNIVDTAIRAVELNS